MEAGQPSDVLRKEIEEQSHGEAAGILEAAEKETQALIGRAHADADRIRQEILEKAGKQAEQIRRRILSGVHLEIKKQQLRAREIMMDGVLREVRKKLKAFRSEPAYKDELLRLILEAVEAVEGESVILVCGSAEAGLLKSAGKMVQKKTGRTVRIQVEQDRSGDGGVLILSEDRRIRYDNRFSARLKRMEKAIRADVMKMIFEESS